MTAGSIVTAVMFAMLAAAHSAAGETGFVRPLLNAEWTIAELPRPAADRLIRAAWHLTSVAWLAMAVIAIGGTPLTAIAVSALVSGLVMLFLVAGHPAWPAFLVAGMAGLRAEGVLVDTTLQITGAITIVALLSAAALHIYWAAGGTAARDAAVPTTEDGGTPTFSPGPMATLSVAVLLVGFAGLLGTLIATVGPATWDTPIVRWMVMAGIAVLAARAVGDGRYAGFSKKFRDSAFGDMDDRFFTPIVVFIALGAAGTLLL